MKQKIFSKLLLMFMAVAVGCADGELKLPGTVDTALTQAAVINFKADKTLIDAGESVTLSWETALAGKVTIESNNVKKAFSFSTEKAEEILKSSTLVENLQEDTTFTLKAYAVKPVVATPSVGKQTAPAKPSETAAAVETPPLTDPVERTVTIHIRKKTGELNITSFYADAEKSTVDDDGNVVYSSDGKTPVVLQWAVVPESDDLKVVLSGNNTEQPILVDCVTNEEIAVTEKYPAAGCARVEPTQNSVYTLTATLGEKTVSKKISIQINNNLKIDSFTVNGGTDAVTVSSFPAEVELSWKVSPADAKVTIEPRLKEVTPLLPANSDEVEGTRFVKLEAETTLTITATLGEESVSETITVRAQSIGPVAVDCSSFVVSSDVTTPLFAGESAAISWSAPETSGAKGVRISSGGVVQEALTISGSASVGVSGAGVIDVVFLAGENSICPRSILVPTATLEKVSDAAAISLATANGNVYVGGNSASFDDKGKSIKIPLSKASPTYAYKDAAVNYSETLAAYNDLTKSLQYPFLKNVIKTFPVNAVAADDSGAAFIGTTGAIFQKTVDGLKTVTSMLRIDYNKNYTGSHETCFGGTQSGKKGNFKGEIVSMSQVCDIAAVGSKLYVASDRGFFSISDVDQYMTDNKSVEWVGRGNEVYDSVVNDIEVVGEQVYVAGSKGVFVSSDSGASFSKVETGVLEGTALSLSVDEKGMFIGTSTGLSVVRDGEVVSNQSDMGAVRKIVVHSNTVYAAAEKGVFVSRDGGVSFHSVNEGSARSVVVFENEGRFNIYVATDGGLLKASAAVMGYVAPEEPVEAFEESVESLEEEAAAPITPVAGQTTKMLSQEMVNESRETREESLNRIY